MSSTPPPASSERPSRFPWGRLFGLAIPLAYGVAELAVFIWISTQIGVLWSLVVVLGTAVLGGWLMARESRSSLAAYRRLRAEGRSPEGEILDVLLIMLGGILLFLPGYLGDVIGLVAILPFTRPLLRRGASALLNRRLRRRGVDVTRLRMQTSSGTIIEGETVIEQRFDPTQSATVKEPPSDESPDGPVIIRGEIDP